MNDVAAQFGLFDDGRKYVIVFNMQSLISPIRHIIELKEMEYDKDEFANWYYESYNKFQDDQFVYCTSSKEMREQKEEICKLYYATESVEDRKKRWKQYCEKNKKKTEGC